MLLGRTLLVIALAALVFCLAMPSVFVNATGSMPVGFYTSSSIAGRPLVRGEMVVGCIPVATIQARRSAGMDIPVGECPGGAIAILKYVAAVPGDRVVETPLGVWVNGTLWNKSAPLNADAWPNAPPATYLNTHSVVPAGHYWLLAHHPDSFDSRYFGPVDFLLRRARPLLVRGT